jgi:PAS domain S-box-containing protein
MPLSAKEPSHPRPYREPTRQARGEAPEDPRQHGDPTIRGGEAFLRKVIDATPSMVFVKDWNGRFVLGNEALGRCYGSPVEAIVGRTDADFNSNAEEVARFLRDDREVMRTRRELLIPEEPVTHADGKVRWFSTVKVPLVEDDGSCDKVLGVATDITERKCAEEALRAVQEELRRSEEALRAADHRKDEFLAILAHELRNPLAAIASAAHVIRSRLANGEDVERPLQILERQTRNSARLLDDLLDVSRITRGILHLRKEQVLLDGVIRSAVESQAALIASAGHRLTITLPREPISLEADPTRLEQIVANLLNNAVKYTPEGGKIAVEAEHEGAEVRIGISDDGNGIPADLLPRVFDLFVQEEQSLARSKGGLGLGLTLVRKLVELHGGSVEARSAGVGKGSTFVVRFPAAPRAEDATSPGARPVEPLPVGRRILIVEDGFDAAELLAEYLGSLGHQVTVAHDGPAALEAARSAAPEIVLLDIGLPGMDGYEVARRLREEARGAGPALVALTGYGQEEDRRRSRAAGFAQHLTKPFEPAALERLLETLGRTSPPRTDEDGT